MREIASVSSNTHSRTINLTETILLIFVSTELKNINYKFSG